MMKNTFDVVLLTALPASGKSEIRNFLAHIEPQRLMKEFHIGDNLQLDDFPYVNFMRRIDEEISLLSEERIFYPTNENPFFDGRDWGTLTALLSEDYHDLLNRTKVEADSPAEYLFERIDRAALTVGIRPRMALLKEEVRKALAKALDAEAQQLTDLKQKQYTDDLQGKTIVIECARGGPDGSSMPLTGTAGYQYYFSNLAPDLLDRAVCLYIKVTPEESRRKNFARANPDDPSSNLFHGTPLPVMMQDYGCDDMEYLCSQARKKNTVTVNAHGKTWDLPVGIFDNSTDKTTFLRADEKEWDPALVEEVTGAVRHATDLMWENYME